MTETEPKTILSPDVEGLKLIKNTKGYNWEIKIIGIDVERLSKIRDDMELKFGGGE